MYRGAHWYLDEQQSRERPEIGIFSIGTVPFHALRPQTNVKQTSLKSFLEKEESSKDETIEDSQPAITKKATFTRKYKESNSNYGDIATGDSHAPNPLCTI